MWNSAELHKLLAVSDLPEICAPAEIITLPPPNSVKEASQRENLGSMSKLWYRMEKPPKSTCHTFPRCQDPNYSIDVDYDTKKHSDKPVSVFIGSQGVLFTGSAPAVRLKMWNMTYIWEKSQKKKKTQSIILFSVLLVMQTCWAQCSSARVFTTTLPILWNAKYSFGFQLRNLITGVKKEQKLIHKCWISREPKLLWLDWDVNLQRLK